MNILPVVPTLKASKEVTDLLGTNPLKVWEDIAPSGTAYPYAVWSVVTANPENHLDCPANTDHVSFQIVVYDNYQKVRLMSTAPIGKAVYEYVRPENPRSPIKVIGQGTIEARITSISFLAHNVGVVRFERTQRDAGGDGRTTRHIATITFDYLAPPLDEADRRINPIGFQVSDYRIDDEAVVSGSVR